MNGIESAPEDEKNLLYVAMTRAKKYLAINGSVLHLLCSVHQNFEKVRFSREVGRESTCVKCLGSRAADQNLFCLERPRKKLSYHEFAYT